MKKRKAKKVTRMTKKTTSKRLSLKKRLKKKFKGFTLIEVSLFLALTGLITIGIIAGVSGQTARHRYNESVQNFAEYLRSLYAQVQNVENLEKGEGGGNTNQVIYGKFIVFGENGKKIESSTIVGDNYIKGTETSLLEIMGAVGATIKNNKGEYYGESEYTPQWGAQIESTRDKTKPMKQGMMIVRSPYDGLIYTVVGPETNFENFLKSGTVGKEIDFCVKSDDSSERRDVRIAENGHNASAVSILDLDGNNPCK